VNHRRTGARVVRDGLLPGSLRSDGAVDLDVYDPSEERMNFVEARAFLKENFRKDCEENFGVKDAKYFEMVTEAWMDDKYNSSHR